MAIAMGELQTLADRFDRVPQRSYSLPARAYTQPGYLAMEQDAIYYKSWQYVCQVEQLRQPGAYIATDIQGQPIIALRDRDGVLRAFYNVCRHRGHELVKGAGIIKTIICPYHAWCYSLDGKLLSARHSNAMENFDFADFGMMPVQIEEFCSMIFVNLDPAAQSLALQSGALAQEIQHYA